MDTTKFKSACLFASLLAVTIYLFNSGRVESALNAVDCDLVTVQCVSGSQVGDSVWTPGRVYVLTDDYTIPADAILTIQAGTVIKGQSAADFVVEGILIALGTAQNPIVFTSEADDSIAGDTNQDGSSTVPAVDDWDNIQIIGGSAQMDHVEIRYSGGNPTVNSSTAAIFTNNSLLTLSNIVIQNSQRSAISVAPSDSLEISNITFENVPIPAIEIRSEEMTADANWNNSDFVYYLEDDITVPTDVTLTLAPGLVLKLDDAADFIVNGTLNSVGLETDPIIFTSFFDDTIGGDTNNDQSGTEPAPDDWDNIQFINGTGILDYTEIRYAGGDSGVSAGDAAIYLENSSPTISNTTFRTGRRSPISASPIDEPAIRNLVFENMPITALEIRGGNLTSNTSWTNTEITYFLDGDLTIEEGVTLNLSPGLVLKFDPGTDLFVNGILNAIGTAADPIKFTSLRDDSVGGDTNNDGSSTAPAAEDWNGVVFFENSNGVLTFVDFAYAGRNSSYLSAIYVRESNPVISNCVLTQNRNGIYNDGNSLTPTVSNCDIFDNVRFGIFNDSESAIVSAQDNWWGSNQGPNDASDTDGAINISSRGDDVTDYVNYSPWKANRIHPALDTDLDTVRYNGTANGAQPGARSIDITNLGGGSLNWTAAADSSWIKLDKLAGQTPDKLTVSVDTTSLTPGAYAGSVVISSPGARQSPQTISVQLTLVSATDAKPIIDVSSSALAFNVAFGANEGGRNPQPQELTIDNLGTGSLSWNLNESIPWLTVDQSSGVAQSTVTASVNISGLNEGTYQGSITVDSPGAENSPANIDVLLVVGCSDVSPVDVMLVVDRSASMAQPDISTFTNAQASANLFIDQMDLLQSQLGLVTFAGFGSLESTLSRDGDQVKGYINDLTVDDGNNNAQSGTNIADAINVAQAELESIRHIFVSKPVIVLLTDGEANRGGDPIQAAAEAKAKGTDIFVIGLGELDEQVLRSIASSNNHYYPAPTSAELIEIYTTLSVNVGCAAGGDIYLPMINR